MDTLIALETQRGETLEQLEAERNRTPTEATLVSAKTMTRSPKDIETRLKLRQRIAELVESIWMLITDNGLQKSSKVTYCHCQVFFKNGEWRESGKEVEANQSDLLAVYHEPERVKGFETTAVRN